MDTTNNRSDLVVKLPDDVKPYSGNLFIGDNGDVWTGKANDYTNLGSWLNSLRILDEKVDKVAGKELSSNDYTDDDKDKLFGIETGAQVNVQSDWLSTMGDSFIKNKPTKLTDFNNDLPLSSYPVTSVNGEVGDVVLTKNHLDLGNVDNTSDLNKPLSNATISALGLKVDKTTTITGSGGIEVGGSLESGSVSLGVSDTWFNNKYLRKDADDNNGGKKLTLGSLETPLANIGSLALPSLMVGDATDSILTVDANGNVKKKSAASDVNIGVSNGVGDKQFSLGATDDIRFVGAGDSSVSFNPATKTVTISSTPGAGGGGAVVSFNGRTGAVVSEEGDYSTDQVTEGTNKYFTDARTRSVVLTGISAASTSPISATDNVLQAFGKAQGQINARAASGRNLTISGAAGRTIASGGTQNLTADREWTVDLAPSGVTSGNYTKVGVDSYGRVTSGGQAAISDIPNLQTELNKGNTAFSERVGSLVWNSGSGYLNILNVGGSKILGNANMGFTKTDINKWNGYDTRFVPFTGGTMTGALKLRNISGLVGSGTSSSYTSYFNFFEPDGVSRIAYIGKGSTGSDNFYVLNEKGDIRVQVPLGNKVVIPIGDLVIEAGGISATGAASFRLMKNTWYNDADGNPRLYFGDNTADNGTLIRAVRQNQTFGIRNENNLQTVKINMTTGEGIFDGTVKAKDAVADNDLVTKRQLPTYREVTITKKLVSGRWFRVSPEEAGISNPLTDKYIISVKSLSGPGVWEYTYKNLTTTSTTLYQLTLYQNQTINGAQVLVLFNNTTDNYTITLSIIDYN